MANEKHRLSVRVYLEPDLFVELRKAARTGDTSLSNFVNGIVRRELASKATVLERRDAALEYAGIQLDVLLTHLDPELKKKAREIFVARMSKGTAPQAEGKRAL